jgi:transposase
LWPHGKADATPLCKAYLKRGKNDANDAAAICEAVTRPSMHFVAIKTKEQQATLMLRRVSLAGKKAKEHPTP